MRPARERRFQILHGQDCGVSNGKRDSTGAPYPTGRAGPGSDFLKNVAALSDYGLSFDICVLARQLPIAINLVSQCPDVVFNPTTVACLK